jgi:DNA-binding NtrC family response regulator
MASRDRSGATSAGEVESPTPAAKLTEKVSVLGPVSYSCRQCRLEVVEGPDAGLGATFDASELVVGTSPECDLVLSDPAVSRRHFTLAQGRDCYKVQDTGSSNGTWLDGVRVAEAYVPDGGMLSAGRTRIRFSALVESIPAFPSQREEFHGLRGRSAAMRQLFSVIEKLAPRPVSVLIAGETGTGKELIARALHRASARAAGPFVVFDCANTDRELVRSELFGHEPGAFTGATGRRQGAFERASGGTIFLDELGELPSDLQPKLLRVLQEREVTRLGGSQPIRIDVRVISASHRELQGMVQRNEFREDLYFRIAQLALRVPALRERREDIPLLAEAFLRTASPGARFEQAALARLQEAEWRGNVRELRNRVEAAAALAEGSMVMLVDVEAAMTGSVSGTHPVVKGASPAPAADLPLDSGSGRTLEDAERAAVAAALEQAGGNISQAARSLGTTRVTLRAKLRKYGLRQD